MDQAKARRYIQQVTAEVQKLYNSQILSGIKNDARHMSAAKQIVSELLSASWKDWRRLPRAKEKYRSAVIAEDLIRKDYQRWSRKQATAAGVKNNKAFSTTAE
jgi:hypothetical protein